MMGAKRTASLVFCAALLGGCGGDFADIDAYMADTWKRMGTVTIVREPPIATQAGKVLPFHLVRRAARR